ncbi:CU044_5270 family protein [Amycolatopsis benzoatilytica]|uniref:CU044_5270 family protein n=1 Tax=Amycolatopsis benzoatilytica TaxID=346045 RepID=UPI000362EF85|nr:CU044_5270 family protein [Amycolatopsis benzoatilytica]
MDELKMVRERAAAVPLPALDDLSAAREKLLRAAAAEVKAERRKKFGWAGAGVAGIAAAITAVAALGPFGSAQTAAADPVRVLHDAAAAALNNPDAPPRGDQFLYVKTQTPAGTREEWLSADGEQDGYVRADGKGMPAPVCVDGKYHPAGEKLPEPKQGCQKTPAYRKGLPATTDQMYKYLGGGSAAMGAKVGQLSSESYLAPQSRAAMYNAVAEVPGLTAVENAKDPAGRAGIGVSWQGTTLVFDPATHAYLGTTAEALVGYGIVDRPGQLPG